MLDDRAGEDVGGDHAAVAQFLLARAGPALVADAGAAQVDHGVGALERARREVPGGRVPAALVRGLRGPADETDDLVPGLPQAGDQGGADESGGPGDDDAHGVIVAECPARRDPGAGRSAVSREDRAAFRAKGTVARLERRGAPFAGTAWLGAYRPKGTFAR